MVLIVTIQPTAALLIFNLYLFTKKGLIQLLEYSAVKYGAYLTNVVVHTLDGAMKKSVLPKLGIVRRGQNFLKKKRKSY